MGSKGREDMGCSKPREGVDFTPSYYKLPSSSTVPKASLTPESLSVRKLLKLQSMLMFSKQVGHNHGCINHG